MTFSRRIDQLAERLVTLVETDETSLARIAKMVGLDPKRAFYGADLDGLDLTAEELDDLGIRAAPTSDEDLTVEQANLTMKDLLASHAAYERNVDVLHTIVSHLYDQARPTLTRVDYKIRIDKSGDGHVGESFTLKATEMPLSLWRLSIEADRSASPVRHLSDIKFKVWLVGSGRQLSIAHLPIREEPLRKEIAFFFLPPIEVGGEETVRIEYSWPRFAGDLLDYGSSRFYLSLASGYSNATAAVSYEIAIDASLGSFRFRQLHLMSPGDRVTSGTDVGDQVFRYENSALRANSIRLEFLAEKESTSYV